MTLTTLARLPFALCLLCVIAHTAHAASTPSPALLVLEKQQNTLVIVDPSTLAIAARVPVGDDPHEVAVSDDGKTAYVSNYGGGGSGGKTIAVVDLTAQKALTPIDLGALRSPHGLVFAGGKLYFTAEGAKVVGRYDPVTHAIDWVIGTGQDRTHMVAVSKDLKTVVTTNVESSTVSIIAQQSEQRRGGGPPPNAGGQGPGEPGRQGGPPGGGGPRAPDWSVANVAVGTGSEGFDLSPDGKEIWVANARDRTVSIIDVATKKVVATLPSTDDANRLKITPDGKYVFVSNQRGKNMLVIDATTRKAFKSIPLPAGSEGVLISPDGSHVYTTLNDRNAVAVIDVKTMAVTGEVMTGRGPDGLAWAAPR